MTAVEALVVYLLNRELVDLLEEYITLQPESSYCPFMIKDKCIIHSYKPTACQMFMPFAYKGKAMCFYLADRDFILPEGESSEGEMNSNCYAVHGFMMMIQSEVADYLPISFFKNIYDGTLWWKEHYHTLPDNTRICLESILNQRDIGNQLTDCFNFRTALHEGHEVYVDLHDKRTALKPL